MSLCLDPRTKALLSLMGMALVLSADTIAAVTVEYALLLIGIFAANATRKYARWLLLVLPMTVFFVLVTTLSFTMSVGVISGFKLLNLTTVGFLFFISTPPEDLANALIKSGLPYTVAFVMSAGLQFVPVLARKAGDVMDAQRVRGIPLRIGWPLLRRLPTLLIPLLIQTFQLAEELAEAMESRGFGRPGRTFYKEFNMRRQDYIVLAVCGLLTIVLSWSLW